LARLDTAETRLAKIDSLAEKEVDNNVAAAKTRLKTAEQKLKQIQFLEQQGAISKFQRYDMEDMYATRKRELLAAQQGIIGTQSERFGSKDFYIQRRNELISAQQQLELSQTNLDKDLASARLTLENRKIELQEALRDLSRTVIYASTDGLVSRVNIHSGEIADARGRDPLLTLTQNTVFKAYIDQARLGAVKVGDTAIVRLIAYPGQSFRGRAIQLNPTVETETIRGKAGIDKQYTYSAWIAVDDLKMSSGLQGYVQFQEGKTALTIPESAVTHLSAGEGMVMVEINGKAVVKKVKFGKTFDNKREVLAGLKPGEQVVLNARALNPGDSIISEPIQVPIAEGH
jgi:HlyD family secretion protein